MIRIFYYLLFTLFAFYQNGNCQVDCITDITVHKKTPKQIYDFLFSLTQEKYLQWHPEHKEFKVLKSTPDTLESIYYFYDLINGFKTDNNWKVIGLERNKKIIMKASQYTVPLIIEIALQEDGNNTRVSHHLKIGKSMTNWIVKYFFTEEVIKDLHRHVLEEYANLEWLIK